MNHDLNEALERERPDAAEAAHTEEVKEVVTEYEAMTEYRHRFGEQECATHFGAVGGRFIAQPFIVLTDGQLQAILNDHGVPVEFPSDDRDTAFARAIVFLTNRFGDLA